MEKLIIELILLISALVSSADGGTLQENDKEWKDYKTLNGKIYTEAKDDELHRTIYYANKLKIKEHNERFKQRIQTYSMAVNAFTDMTVDELKIVVGSYSQVPNRQRPPKISSMFQKTSLQELPSSVNWTAKGYVTPVKNQGKCGSCYSFVATGALEGQYFAQTGNLVSMSEQNLVDCTTDYGNHGCDGGNVQPCFQYVVDNAGINSEDSYPYTEQKGQCSYQSANSSYCSAATGYVVIDAAGNEKVLQAAVAFIGPLAVPVDASDMTQYSGGIFYDDKCNSSNLNHALLLVGYGTSTVTFGTEQPVEPMDYWLAKNSWGSNWGEAGYIRIARNKNNHCGIATGATYPVLGDSLLNHLQSVIDK